MESCRDFGIKRLIITSDLYTVIGSMAKGKDATYDETDEPCEKGLGEYELAKIAQERQVREFIKDNPDMELQIATIHPGFMMGPCLFKVATSSAEALSALIKRDFPGVPDLNSPTVDVRDVGTAHVKCLSLPNIHG